MVLTPPLSGRLLRALAASIAVLLVGGLLAAVAVSRDGAAGRAGGGRGGSAASELEQLVPALQRFVEEARGLSFKAPVKVAFLADEAFRDRLEDRSERDADDLARVKAAEEVLRALGLLDAGVDLADAVDSLLGSAVAGFYDPRTDELVVRGDRADAGVLATVVHELTHALQDQHFELHRPALEDRDDEAADAFTALAEGDAVRVERLYLESLPPAERRRAEAAEAEAARQIDPDLPPVLLQLVGFPYVAGPLFVAEVLARAGRAALDRAFASPPVSSEQVLHPETYLAGDGPKEVAPPTPSGEVTDEGVLGELGLLLVLAEQLARPEAVDAARGWGGDRYVAWRSGASTCVRTAIVMDTAGDADQLRVALRRWAARRAGVTVDTAGGPGPVVFTSCG